MLVPVSCFVKAQPHFDEGPLSASACNTPLGKSAPYADLCSSPGLGATAGGCLVRTTAHARLSDPNYTDVWR